MFDLSMWRFAYVPFVVLSGLGVYLMLSHRNFLNALVGLQVFQTGIILFFIILAVKPGGTIPIQPKLDHGDPKGAEHAAVEPREQTSTAHGPAERPGQDDADHGPGHDDGHAGNDPDKAHGKSHYDAHAVMHNPLPHALMLTAIVVGVATQGVGLAILRRLRSERGTIEDERAPAEWEVT